LELGLLLVSDLNLNYCGLHRSIAALVYIARWAPAVLLPGSVLGLLMATATGAVLGATGVVVLLVRYNSYKTLLSRCMSMTWSRSVLFNVSLPSGHAVPFRLAAHVTRAQSSTTPDRLAAGFNTNEQATTTHGLNHQPKVDLSHLPCLQAGLWYALTKPAKAAKAQQAAKQAAALAAAPPSSTATEIGTLVASPAGFSGAVWTVPSDRCACCAAGGTTVLLDTALHSTALPCWGMSMLWKRCCTLCAASVVSGRALG
jgi:hypothetical protein